MRSTSVTISVPLELMTKIEDYQVERYGIRPRTFSLSAVDLIRFGFIYLLLEQEKSAQAAIKRAHKVIDEENSQRKLQVKKRWGGAKP